MNFLSSKELNNIIESINFKDGEAEKIEDPESRQFLEYVHILNQFEVGVIKIDDKYSIKDLFYSRYYWFSQFKKRYLAIYGHDEGLEQQSYKMLENFNERFPNDVDWGTIEKIDNNTINVI